ncbi:MAG: serine protease [Candidatus Paceibacterota bacterium]
MLTNLIKISLFFSLAILVWFIYPREVNKNLPVVGEELKIEFPEETFDTDTVLEEKVKTENQTKEENKAKPTVEKIEVVSKKTSSDNQNPVNSEQPKNTNSTKESGDFVELNEKSRKSIVNILCKTNGNDLSTITGTGVIIDPRGIILTNAHIGQYFLLKDFKFKNFVECTIRTGEPAYPKYEAELVYISPEWVEANKSILTEENPKGTGEYDFAFLRITKAIDGTVLPSFDYIKPDTREIIDEGEPVLLASYPAGFLGSISVIQGLYITSAVTTVQKIFTFKETTIDLLSVGGTVLSQKGSSGGAVIDRYGKLIGLISTSSDGDTTSERDLRAITMTHINRSLKESFGGLNSFLGLNMETTADIFKKTLFPSLSQLIINELKK